MTDDRTAEDVLRAALRRLNDASDVLVAVAAASRLLVESLDSLQLEIMELGRRAEDAESGRTEG
jgi:hypothetical protein